MKTKVYIFNPDHDMAMANHDMNYMAPASARQFSADCALFPAWYAGEKHEVLATSTYNLAFLNQMRVDFPGLASLLTEPEVTMARDVCFMPWGWDSAVYKRLIQLGVKPHMLPTESQLNSIREKSNRMQAVEMLKRLRFNRCCGESTYLTELCDLKKYVESRESCLLKAPLSGSGKGLQWGRGVFTTPVSDWCRNVLRQQDGVVAEPVYNKVLDFAMQFHADTDGKVHFSAYSLFHTSANGAYSGNYLTTDADIEVQITRFVPLSLLQQVRNALEKELAKLIDRAYIGYLGVDMMVCSAAEYQLHPCVEINLRMNMGMASRVIYDRYVSPGVKGILKVSYYPSNESLQEEHQRMKNAYPLWVEGGKVVRGYLPLVPVTPRARYGISLTVGYPVSF